MDTKKIAIVVPTIRPESYTEFEKAWKPLIDKYKILVVKVEDGEEPKANGKTVAEIMGDYSDLIYNFNDGVRNLGFALIAKEHKDIEYIISFDDDVVPYGDTIQQHVNILNKRVPISWLSTASKYMRGFPYAVRSEAEVMMSHGVWMGVKDWDAPTQLLAGNPDVTFYQGPIPKGIFYPHCAMNFAFKRKALPFIYQAPMNEKVGYNRFADIWMGIECKKDFDSLGWAVVSGHAYVYHNRASDVFTNMVKEARGLGLNETYYKPEAQDEYITLHREKRTRWKEFISKNP